MNKEAYEFGFINEIEKMARKLTLPEPGWSKPSGSKYWQKGSEISSHRPTRRVSKSKYRRQQRRLSDIHKSR